MKLVIHHFLTAWLERRHQYSLFPYCCVSTFRGELTLNDLHLWQLLWHKLKFHLSSLIVVKRCWTVRLFLRLSQYIFTQFSLMRMPQSNLISGRDDASASFLGGKRGRGEGAACFHTCRIKTFMTQSAFTAGQQHSYKDHQLFSSLTKRKKSCRGESGGIMLGPDCFIKSKHQQRSLLGTVREFVPVCAFAPTLFSLWMC